MSCLSAAIGVLSQQEEGIGPSLPLLQPFQRDLVSPGLSSSQMHGERVLGKFSPEFVLLLLRAFCLKQQGLGQVDNDRREQQLRAYRGMRLSQVSSQLRGGSKTRKLRS